MHELALAEAIAAIAEEHSGGRRVERVDVKVGELRQVVPDTLAFGFELVVKGTALEGAELDIERVPLRVSCPSCEVDAASSGFPLTCPSCGSADVEIVGGDELLVEALELAESTERV